MVFRANTDNDPGVNSGLSWEQQDKSGGRQSDGATGPITAGGGPGDRYVVYRMRPESDRVVPYGGAVSVHVHDDLAVPGQLGAYAASITAYRDPDDALIGANALKVFAGHAEVVEVVSGVAAEVSPGPVAVADFGQGYL